MMGMSRKQEDVMAVMRKRGSQRRYLGAANAGACLSDDHQEALSWSKGQITSIGSPP